MKKIVAIIVLLLAAFGVYRFFQQPMPANSTIPEKQIVTKKVSEEPQTENFIENKKLLFVPYWNASVNSSTFAEYDTFVYFGIAVDETGHIRQDEGYAGIQRFISSTAGKKQLLTLRMLNSDINHAILEDASKQEVLIREVIPLLHEYDFDGLVLDLEVSALPLTDIKNNISLFIKRVGDEVKAENKHMAATIYGDVFYRARPYDMKAIGQSVDEVMIMAYDFHKSRGEPGPNFPFAGRESYGYDFDAMISDFTNYVSVEQVTVLFGMYGYDWTLGPQGKPLKAAHALPLDDIQSMTQPSCDLRNCNLQTDKETKESRVTYTDDDGYAHELWYEDESSVAVKTQYLKEKGIGSVGYWVYGYW